MERIPASEILPPAFSSQSPEWLWRPRDIPKGNCHHMYLCSKATTGWRYFTIKKDPKLSLEYPVNFAEDVGYKYKHGPGLVDSNGKPMEEKDTPTKVLIMRVWVRELNAMRCAVIDSWPLQQALAQIFSNPEFELCGSKSDGYVSNFYLQIWHNEKPANASLTYTAQGYLRPPQNEEMLMRAAEPWFGEAFFDGLNPFEGPIEPPANAGEPLAPVPTVRDRQGADMPAQPRPTEEKW